MNGAFRPIILRPLLAALICLAVTIQAQAQAVLDPPHDSQGCLSCHDMNAFDQPDLIPNDPPYVESDMDDTLYNSICRGCHNGTDAPLAFPHSSITTSNKYGNWTVGCSVCHNQHIQEQNRDFGSTYGQFIRTRIDLAKIKDDLGNSIKTGVKNVKFLGNTGPNSFADGDPAAIDGICEVCHTLTQHWTNDGTKANLGVHAGLGGTNCMGCHGHGSGFKADCSACHGFPPGALVSNPGTTGSATAGAHIEHYTNQNISCDSCHYNNFPAGEHNNGAPLSITIGFNPGSPIPQGGDYDGQSGVIYDRTTTTPATNVTAGNTKTCSIIYCHGNYPGSGLAASPVWDNPATGNCGTCHDASNVADSGPASGSHEKHVDTDQTINAVAQTTFNRGYQCTFCHKAIVGGSGPASYTIADKAKHVNGTVDWAFDATEPRLSADSTYGTASGTATPTNGVNPNRLYSTCNNVYCHSIAQTATGGALTSNTSDYKTPTWGGSVTCGGCHKQDGGHSAGPAMDSGSHSAHLAYGFTAAGSYKKCELCHKYGTTAVSVADCNTCHINGEKTNHVNGQVDLLFDPAYVGGTAAYSGTAAPGDGFSTCATTYCHGNGTAVSTGTINANTSPAWGTAGPLTCDSCHDGTATGPSYANGSPKANSHNKHVSGGLTCDTCHYTTTNDGTTIASKTTHVNRTYNVDPAPTTSLTYTYNAAGGTCSSTYCHGAGSPQWGGTVNCGDCHGVNNTLAQSHQTHYGVATAGDWAAGLNDNATAGAYAFNCVNCHDNAENPSGVHGDGVQSDPQTADIFFDTGTVGYGSSSYTKGAEHGSSPDPNGFKYSQGTCDNTYCHSDGTVVSTTTIAANTSPAWGSAGPLACNACHGNGPAYANGTPKANTHVEHIGAGATCDDCHNATTTTGNTITDKTRHMNMVYDVVAGNGESFTYTYVQGGQSTCSTVSCHGGTFSAKWGHQPHNVSYDPLVDLSQVSMPGDNPCGDCHSGNNADGDGTPLNSWKDILSEHLGSCATCHAYTDDGNNTPLEADVNAAIAGGGPVTCTDCHKPKLDPAATSDHGGHADTHFGWSGNCQNCHGAGAGAEAVVSVIHSNNCDLCHTGGTYNKTTNGAGPAANGVDGDAGLAEGAADAGTPFDPTVYTCTLCHDVTGVNVNAATLGGIHHENKTDGVVAEAQCTSKCHNVNGHEGDHTTRIEAPANSCATCHTNTAGGGAGVGAPINAADPKVHDGCLTCHGIAGATARDGYLLDKASADTHDPDWITAMPNGGPGTNNGGGLCTDCHTTYFNTHTHPHTFTPDASCATCHGNPTPATSNARDAVSAPFVGAGEVHATLGCATCHDLDGTPTGALIGSATGNASATGCTSCHIGGTKTWTTVHMNGTSDGAVSGVDHSGRVDGLGACTACHTATAGGPNGLMPINSAATRTGDMAHDSCAVCHTGANDGGLNGGNTTYGNQPIAKGNCGTCHTAGYFDSHVHGTDTGYISHVLTYEVDGLDGNSGTTGDNDTSQPTPQGCANCHNGNNADGNGTPLDSWTDILSEHVSGCGRCHSYTDDGQGTPPEALVTAAIGSRTPASCDTCHEPKTPNVKHGGHTATDFGWTAATKTSCGTASCHDWTNNQDVVTDIHNGTCTNCHSTPSGGDGTTVARDVGDATNGSTTPPHPDACTVCHILVKNRTHHDRSNSYAANGTCSQCHTDPRVARGYRQIMQMSCRACHVRKNGTTLEIVSITIGKEGGAGTGDDSGNTYTAITAANGFSADHTFNNTNATDETDAIANYGICFECHGATGRSGYAAATNPLPYHALPKPGAYDAVINTIGGDGWQGNLGIGDASGSHFRGNQNWNAASNNSYFPLGKGRLNVGYAQHSIAKGSTNMQSYKAPNNSAGATYQSFVAGLNFGKQIVQHNGAAPAYVPHFDAACPTCDTVTITSFNTYSNKGKLTKWDVTATSSTGANLHLIWGGVDFGTFASGSTFTVTYRDDGNQPVDQYLCLDQFNSFNASQYAIVSEDGGAAISSAAELAPQRGAGTSDSPSGSCSYR